MISYLTAAFLFFHNLFGSVKRCVFFILFLFSFTLGSVAVASLGPSLLPLIAFTTSDQEPLGCQILREERSPMEKEKTEGHQLLSYGATYLSIVQLVKLLRKCQL